MAIARRVIRNTAWLLAAQGFNIFLQLIYVVALARYLGPVGFGKISFALAFTQLFIMATDIGLTNYTVREVARKKDEAARYLGNQLALRAIMGCLILGAIIGIAHPLHQSADVKWAVYLLGVSLIFHALSSAFNSILRAFERLDLVSLNITTFYILNVAASIFLLLMGKGIIALAIAYSLARAAAFVLTAVIFARKFFLPKIKMEFSFWKIMLRGAVPIGLGALFYTVYDRIDVTMLSLMKGDIAVANYTAAYRLTATLIFIPAAFFDSAFPVMARIYGTASGALREVSEDSLRLMGAAAFPLALSIGFLAPRLIPFLYGGEYNLAISVLRVLTLSIPVIFIGNTFGYLLISSSARVWDYTVIAALGVLINVVLNFLLIPAFGPRGAAFATVATELAVSICYFLRIPSDLLRIDLLGSIKKPLLAGMAMALCLYILNNLNAVLLIFISATIYLLVLFLLKGIPVGKMGIIKRAVLRAEIQ